MIKIESYKKGVLTSTILNLIAKGIAFLNTLIITYYFGTSTSTDVYFYLLSVVSLITGMINGIDYFVIIPEAIKIREQQSEHNSQKFINFFIYTYCSIASIFFSLGLCCPLIFYTFFSKYDVVVLSQNINLLYVGSVFILFQLLNNLLTAVLTSYKYFSSTIITGLITSLFSIVFTFFCHNKVGILGTVIGVAIGYIINFLLLVYILIRYQNWNFLLVSWLKDKRVWFNILLMQINILPVWIRNFLTILFLTKMTEGVVSAFNLGQMLAALPEVFILSQVLSVLGIKLSELAANKDYLATNIVLKNTIDTLFMIVLPLAIIMVISNKEIIKIVFERGSFKAGSMQLTAFCFMFFSFLLPTKVFDLIFSRVFTSFQLYGISTVVAVVTHTLITVLIYIGIKKYTLAGYFYGLLIGYYVLMPIAFYLIIKYKMKVLKINSIVLNVLKLLLLAIIVYCTCNFLYKYFPQNLFLKPILLSLVVMVLFYGLVVSFMECSFQKKLVYGMVKKIYNR